MLGLPVFLIERKHPSAAKAIRTAGKVIGVLLLVAVILLMIFPDV